MVDSSRDGVGRLLTLFDMTVGIPEMPGLAADMPDGIIPTLGSDNMDNASAPAVGADVTPRGLGIGADLEDNIPGVAADLPAIAGDMSGSPAVGADQGTAADQIGGPAIAADGDPASPSNAAPAVGAYMARGVSVAADGPIDMSPSVAVNIVTAYGPVQSPAVAADQQ